MRLDAAPPLTVDLWSMETPGFPIEKGLAVLDDDERGRAGRFLHARDRRDYVAAHALVRHLLAALGAGRPAAIRFLAEAHGKPRLSAAAGVPDLRFNLTHTDGLVAVAAAEGAEVGIDAEATDRRVDDGVAPAVFTAAELALLEGLDGVARQQAFFRLWTLKEAAVKMLGTGLATPLRAIQVLGDPPRLGFPGGRPAATGGYHLRSEAPTARHLLALAVARGDRPVTVRRRVVTADTLEAAQAAETRAA
jgi:4'-phosphopantetheinyl transferase